MNSCTRANHAGTCEPGAIWSVTCVDARSCSGSAAEPSGGTDSSGSSTSPRSGSLASLGSASESSVASPSSSVPARKRNSAQNAKSTDLMSRPRQLAAGSASPLHATVTVNSQKASRLTVKQRCQVAWLHRSVGSLGPPGFSNHLGATLVICEIQEPPQCIPTHKSDLDLSTFCHSTLGGDPASQSCCSVYI